MMDVNAHKIILFPTTLVRITIINKILQTYC